MEAFFQLLSLLIIPHLCQTRPGALVCGRVGDQPKAAAFPAESASTDVIELTSTSSPSAVTLEDGRYAWGPVEVEAEAASAGEEDFRRCFQSRQPRPRQLPCYQRLRMLLS